MPLSILPVRTGREKRIFLNFPWRIYRGDPLWVPPILRERARQIDPARGPFFKRGRAKFFIAWRNGKPAGTICAAEDQKINELRGKRECLFGFFECLNDYAVAEAMLQRAAEWARQHRLNTLHGPFNLDYEDSYGVLLEGRDRPPVLLCGHTPPYYRDFLERFGFHPARGDNLAYAIELDRETPSLKRLSRLADRVRRQGHIKVREADFSHWEEEVERVHRIINQALAHLPDFIPWRLDVLQATLAPFRKLSDPDLILFAEIKGEPAGWFPGIPNWNEALLHAGGLRYPWNYLRLWLHMRRRPGCLAVKSVLVLPKYWGTGVSVLLFDEMAARARAKGFKWVDLSLTSTDNPNTPALAERMGARVYKRYRVYRLEL